MGRTGIRRGIYSSEEHRDTEVLRRTTWDTHDTDVQRANLQPVTATKGIHGCYLMTCTQAANMARSRNSKAIKPAALPKDKRDA
eukprot:2971346-Amphidinium_carterae.2